MIGSPFVKPAEYLFVSTVLTATAVYGYSSSLVGGGVLFGATGAVCGLDIATSPLVATYIIFSNSNPTADTLERPLDVNVECR